jgi:hypothetical protein
VRKRFSGKKIMQTLFMKYPYLAGSVTAGIMVAILVTA